MPRGGARPGAGRKSSPANIKMREIATLEVKTGAETRIEQLKSAVTGNTVREMITPWLPELLCGLKQLSEGIWIEHPILGIVYKKEPNAKALTYLIDRIAGRAGQSQNGLEIGTVETLFELQARAEKEILDDELDPELSRGLRERINERFANLLGRCQAQRRELGGSAQSAADTGQPG